MTKPYGNKQEGYHATAIYKCLECGATSNLGMRVKMMEEFIVYQTCHCGGRANRTRLTWDKGPKGP